MSLLAVAFTMLLAGADQNPVRPADIAPTSVIAQGEESIPASTGLTLDAATRERPLEVVCRTMARSTTTRIGTGRVCRTRIDWARREAVSRRFYDEVTNNGSGRGNPDAGRSQG